jgi:UDP-glucose 4-epimerase
MKALVTGATGFLGSRLTELLVNAGHTVAILRRQSTRPWRIQKLLPSVRSILADPENPETAEEPIIDFAPDILFHTGWHGVSGTLRNEVSQIGRNLGSSAALIELAARAGCKSLIALGSQAEYGPQNRILDEHATVAPTTTYGVAKQCAYLISRHLAARTGMRLVWVRVFSLYGPGDTPDFMIPSLVRALLRGERPSLTTGEQLWDYLYVQDAATAIYRLGMTPGAEGVFNLGSGQVHTIRYIVEQIRDLIDPNLPLGIGEVSYRPDQVMHLQADISCLTAATGWLPHTTLADGLSKTIDWYRSQGGV